MTIEIYPENYFLDYGINKTLCKVLSGEEIVTRIVDAHGYDHELRKVAGSPNPLTGPFYIQNAQPGNVLAVTIQNIIPNRTTGWASKSMHPNLNLPERKNEPNKKEYVDWDIDLKEMIARLPEKYFPKTTVSLPLRPVLGCIGVATGGGVAPQSIECGVFGGNLDYTRIMAGTTLYLPVQVEGGYLYVGDGHAVQGDGEITGNGIEISCDLRFSVRVVKNNFTRLRGEDNEYIFCLGNAPSIDEALREATADMQASLTGTYGFSLDQAGILMGQLVKYEVGNFVSQDYCAACLLPKFCLSS